MTHARCHPHRPVLARGMCGPCYQSKYYRGLLGEKQKWEPRQPVERRSIHYEQVIGRLADRPYGPLMAPPPPQPRVRACHKCGNECLRSDGVEVSCLRCGWAVVVA